ncbi:MAG: deoxyguanosinetriphosphate triphosphohydrolase [Thermoflexales bacterium]|nr:deoxyguanosinetriphosphate triphosphohydrolase [Thermoflexales bacterium]
MRTREELEAIERATLAPYAMKSAESRGRHHPEPEAAYRTAFQRDRDRILHTSTFRRLQGKTQVFTVTEGDYYRTRITHTLEVAQIGRTIARALGANEDLVEGICLAHDLGHPPFGHAGERALNALMEGHGGFDHNQQSLRIVTELEQRYAGFNGLNLTFELREGLVKHHADHSSDFVPAEYLPGQNGTLEAQIAAYADELTYNAHDLDDGLRSGLIEPQEVVALGWWQRASALAGVDDPTPSDSLTRHRVVRKLIGAMVTDLLQETTQRLAALNPPDVDAVRRWHSPVVGFSAEAQALNRELRAFLRERMYHHPRVIRMSHKAERLLRDLFKVYLREPRMLPKRRQAFLASLPLHRVVCDYIAGMTDRFALEEHARLFDPRERV